MITSWGYNHAGGIRDDVKKMISSRSYSCIDIGASAMQWSYPECMFVADSIAPIEPVRWFDVDLDNKKTWSELLDYVDKNGLFDFSICSHTLEDIHCPLELIYLISKISRSGFIAMPSKANEFCFLQQNPYRGNAHHKHIFDINDGVLEIYHKYSWIERDDRSDLVRDIGIDEEISFFWEGDIPVRFFGNGIPFRSDGELISSYYQSLLR